MRNVATVLTALANEWPLWLPLLVGALAIYLLLPRPKPYPAALGALAGGLSLFLIAAFILRTSGIDPEVVLFYAFSGLAVLGAAMLVTNHNPARAALSFTLVVLSSCGLFLLLGAPFLMAATIIIYAGAIIVTFLFVLMLAQQAGLSDADARSREPVFATLTGFLLLATILYVLQGYQTRSVDDLLRRTEAALAADSRLDADQYVGRDTDDHQLFKLTETLLRAGGLPEPVEQVRMASSHWSTAAPGDLADARQALEQLRTVLQNNQAPLRERLVTARLPAGSKVTLSELSGPSPAKPLPPDAHGRRPLPAENAAYLGRSLFTDYLLPVEIGGLLLLAATVGAIAIAQRRENAS